MLQIRSFDDLERVLTMGREFGLASISVDGISVAFAPGGWRKVSPQETAAAPALPPRAPNPITDGLVVDGQPVTEDDLFGASGG